MPKTPTAARAALVAAVQAVRDRADERKQTEAAYELAVQDVQKSWATIAEIEAAIRDRPQSAAEQLLARAGRSTPQQVLIQIEDQVLAESLSGIIPLIWQVDAA